jgi:hypothetical protein
VISSSPSRPRSASPAIAASGASGSAAHCRGDLGERRFGIADQDGVGARLQVARRVVGRVRSVHHDAAPAPARRGDHLDRRLAQPHGAHLGDVVEAVLDDGDDARARGGQRGLELVHPSASMASNSVTSCPCSRSTEAHSRVASGG